MSSTASTSSDSYTRVAIWLHWLIALLVIGNIAGAIAFGQLKDSSLAADKALATDIINLHKAGGFTILALTLVLLLWRLTHPSPPLPAHMTGGEKLLARATHSLFYLLLLALPIGGWVFTSAGPYPLSWYGLFDIPKLDMAGNKALAEAAHEAHEIGGLLMLALALLHLAAVAKHQWIDRDTVAARMLPFLKKR